MKNYTNFLYERKAHKLNSKDSKELQDFLYHVLENMEDQPFLLRTAYARIQGILNEIRKGNFAKGQLSYFFYLIHMFIEGKRNKNDLREWSEKLMKIDIDNYEVLLNIIHDYNQLVHKNKDNFGKINDQQVFNIRDWVFEPEGIEPIRELMENDDNIQRLFMSDDITGEEKEKLKYRLPRKSIQEMDDSRDWKLGDVMLDGSTEMHYLVSESYEDFCDFGCGAIATYLAENPDINEDEFGEYVCQHNKADRDMGELQDVCEEEIERLGKEFKSQMVKESNGEDAETVYQNSLKDDYWKEISDKFPNYNSDECYKATKYIYKKMKETYPDHNWKLIGKQVEKKILDGIT